MVNALAMHVLRYLPLLQQLRLLPLQVAYFCASKMIVYTKLPWAGTELLVSFVGLYTCVAFSVDFNTL